ncbi:MAG: DUF503 domain-containing protein [Thermodesulfobacteriota bacterium]
MVVGVCHIGLLIHGSQSLKDKRQILKKVIEGARNRFNVSVAEVGSQDLWQKAEIGISVVGSDVSVINSVVDRLINFIEDMHAAEIIDHDIEFINYSLEGKDKKYIV